MSEPPSSLASDTPRKRAASAAEVLKQRIHDHFNRLREAGVDANEAAAQALAAAQAELQSEQAQRASTAAEAEADVTAEAAAAPSALQQPGAGTSRYGPLCLGLVGPFQSICVVGEPRAGKKLVVLDIDHTIYDPSEHEGCRGSTVKSNRNGFFDESTLARPRPGLHEFLTEVYKEFDIMVWSASDMTRILTLLQQLGMLGAGHSDYKLVAVLDIDSMSELMPTSGEGEDKSLEFDKDALVQEIVVPEGAIPGQQISATSIADGKPMVVAVPPGLKPGDTFHVTIPGAVSSVSDELDIDAADIQLALQMSMGQCPESDAATAAPALLKARRQSKSVKPLSLIWACGEFSKLYTEKNTVIVDDTIDVCSANPHNSIQVCRYYWRNQSTDNELPLLSRYLMRIAQSDSFPDSHSRWRDNL
eukprot:TRINITY_DN25914_c0_g1_i1.p1 TRINITY_DN25914_c0_g1~~TRINITY_DN25914_c0_g1_i1.p1  ORF type:complete len:418 (-),score=82.21 TRINITY_DN25914_c0_g1_i1:222-1475(-)